MNNIKRYDPEVYACNGLGRPGIMHETDDGGYVDYDDYESLLKKFNSLHELWERVIVVPRYFSLTAGDGISSWEDKHKELNKRLINEWVNDEQAHQLREMGFLK